MLGNDLEESTWGWVMKRWCIYRLSLLHIHGTDLALSPTLLHKPSIQSTDVFLNSERGLLNSCRSYQRLPTERLEQKGCPKPAMRTCSVRDRPPFNLSCSTAVTTRSILASAASSLFRSPGNSAAAPASFCCNSSRDGRPGMGSNRVSRIGSKGVAPANGGDS